VVAQWTELQHLAKLREIDSRRISSSDRKTSLHIQGIQQTQTGFKLGGCSPERGVSFYFLKIASNHILISRPPRKPNFYPQFCNTCSPSTQQSIARLEKNTREGLCQLGLTKYCVSCASKRSYSHLKRSVDGGLLIAACLAPRYFLSDFPVSLAIESRMYC
jgi:hypothetical protein